VEGAGVDTIACVAALIGAVEFVEDGLVVADVVEGAAVVGGVSVEGAGVDTIACVAALVVVVGFIELALDV